MSSKQLSLFADDGMFVAEKIDHAGPRVTMVNGTRDPLGVIAQKAKAYQGIFPRSLAEISDEDRRYYMKDVRKNALGSPMECVQLEFLIEGVTRGFTHQLVRQRVGAAYQQESLRFAVKEDFPVGLPPSLLGTDPLEFDNNYEEYLRSVKYDPDCFGGTDEDRKRCARQLEDAYQYAEKHTSREGLLRRDWDAGVEHAKVTYLKLIANGMTSEDARGIVPTNILTKINYTTSLRGLIDHAGLRLCEQAQYEWKQVWAQILSAIRAYGKSVGDGERWQWEEIATVFKPICYKTGKCEFMSDFDRYCNIREQVQAFYRNGVPSFEWEQDHADLGIPEINPAQWLDPNAAIRKSGDWRSEQAQANIKGRR